MLKSENKKNVFRLSELCVGSEACVVDIVTNDLLMRRRMYDMGILKGTWVRVNRIAPFGGIACLELRGYEIGLRNSELKNIVVRVVK